MTLQAAFDEQIGRYRRMTGEQRLAIALDLHELSCDIAREGIRRQNPGASEAQVERLLRERRLIALGVSEALRKRLVGEIKPKRT